MPHSPSVSLTRASSLPEGAYCQFDFKSWIFRTAKKLLFRQRAGVQWTPLQTKCCFFGREIRVVGTCGAAETRLLYRENFELQTTISFYREKVTSSAEDLGWRYLNPRGSYSSTCVRDFPIQADVTVKQKTVAKLLCATLRRICFVRTSCGG